LQIFSSNYSVSFILIKLQYSEMNVDFNYRSPQTRIMNKIVGLVIFATSKTKLSYQFQRNCTAKLSHVKKTVEKLRCHVKNDEKVFEIFI